MLDKVYAKTLLLYFGILVLSTRVVITFGLFFSGHDRILSLAILLGIISLCFGLVLLVVFIYKGLKRNLKGFLIFIAILLTVFFFPFEYIFGWTIHQFNHDYRKEIINNLDSGKYDSLIIKNEYPQYGTWIKSNPRVKIFKDNSLQMIFITHGNIASYDYYGTLFISDASKIQDKRVYNFLYNEFNKRRLSNNWFLIECYTDVTPGP
jgi:hypothetical protein